jgi:hypothetical protein
MKGDLGYQPSFLQKSSFLTILGTANDVVRGYYKTVHR